MAKRETVKVDVIKILELTALHGWSAATLAKRVGKHERWLSEVKRGKNLPSPEEAVRMCALLNTTPEEILVEQADIDLVNHLLDEERAKHDLGIQKLPATMGGEMTDAQKEAWELIQKFDDEKLKKFIAAAKAMLGD